MATDSRLTWCDGTQWDEAKKVYVSTKQPFVFSFCGDSLFPTHALVKVTDALNAGIVSGPDAVKAIIKKLWGAYPQKLRKNFTIYVGHRDGSGMSSQFKLFELKLIDSASGGRWLNSDITLGGKSAVLITDGSGKATIERYLAAWHMTPSKRTSRAYYSAFADAVASVTGDSNTGGAPQVGGMYRIGAGRLFGVVHEHSGGRKRRYFDGADLTGSENSAAIEWRNDLFERMDASTKKRLLGAEVHDPRRFRLREEESNAN